MQELEMLCTMCIWHKSKRNGIIGPYAYFSFLISVDVKKILWTSSKADQVIPKQNTEGKIY